jgi:DNA segregation ATPase FtsK/SpoIIIE, S-DNA-T family
VVLRAPVPMPRPVPGGAVVRLLPLAMVCATVAVIVFSLTTGSPVTKQPMFLLWPAMMLVSAVTMLAGGGLSRSRSAEVDVDRKAYLRYLQRMRETVAETAAAQRASMLWRHPDPEALWTLVGTARMWERHSDDPDFCHVRVGIGRQPLATPLVCSEGDGDREPVTEAAGRRFVRAHSAVGGVPIAVPLGSFSRVIVDGDAPTARALVRSMVCQVAVMHAPSALRLAADVVRQTQHHWEWLKWLPHLLAGDVQPVGSAFVEIVDRGDGAIAMRLSPHRGDTALRLTVTPERVSGDEIACCPDVLGIEQALVCARLLAAYGEAPASVDLDVGWRDADDEQRLRVPIGTASDGSVVELDLKESAEGGMGPHGLCVGATGSGKSELLRTLTLGLITRHPPEVVNLVLVDFKGGATFLGFERASHVAAVITNLSDEAHLVARMKEALTGEIHRRQELLRAAGAFTNVAEYTRARACGAALAPLPALVVVVDEFTELLAQHPDFAELFVTIGRLGRSLRIHLLLASQRLDEARLRGLESHLSYRICLKTFSASESRAVIGIPDAFHLPNRPGSAYLQTGPDQPVRFDGAFVSAPSAADEPVARPQRFSAWPVRRSTRGRPPTVLQTALNRLAGCGTPAHPIWLAPLAESPRLASLLAETRVVERLSVPIGVIDSPYDHRRDPLTLRLSGSTGNLAIVGAPQSGKSAAMSTVITSLALTHDPDQVQFYCLDFGGGTLAPFAALPHVGAVAGRADRDLVRRTVAQLTSTMRDREKAGWSGDIFLVVDDWSTLRREYESLESPITVLAALGLSYGIHVAVTASRWADLRPALRDQLGSRIELRLGDAGDSELNRRAAQHVPDNRPGSGITREGKDMVIAAPCDAPGIADVLRRRYPGQRAPSIRLLPELIAREAIDASTVTIGIDEDELRPVCLDFVDPRHLLILGDTGCGKTAALRLLCRELVRTNTPDEAALFIVDYRRTLLGTVDSDHLAGYAMSESDWLPGLCARLQARLPGPDVTQRQLRSRCWWTGPQLFVIVDDYDLAGTDSLTPLLDFLPYATDIGLHLIIARGATGVARAMFEPVLGRMRQLGCDALVMSASPDEGIVFGSMRARALPPGRGTLVRRRGETMIQVAWTQP